MKIATYPKLYYGSMRVFFAALLLYSIYCAIWEIWHISIVNGPLLLVCSLPWSWPYLHWWREINDLIGKGARYWLDVSVMGLGLSLNCAAVYAGCVTLRTWRERRRDSRARY